MVLFLTPLVLAYLLDISSQMSGPFVPVSRCSAHTTGFGMLLSCPSLLCVCSDGNSRGRFPVVSQGHCRPWVDQRSLFLSSSWGPLLAGCWLPRRALPCFSLALGPPHEHLHGQCLLPPHVLTFRLDSSAWQGCCVFPPSRWRHLPPKSHADAPAPSLLLLIVLMRNSILQRGSSDYPRVLSCVEKNSYTWAPLGPSHKRKVPEPHRHLFNDISLQRPFCDQPQFCSGQATLPSFSGPL